VIKKLALLCLVLAGCVSKPVVPPAPAANPVSAQTPAKRAITVPSALIPPPVSTIKRATVKSAVAAIIVPPPVQTNVFIAWNYGTNHSMTAVYFSTDLSQAMTLLTNTADTTFVTPLSAVGFFKIAAIASVGLEWIPSVSTNVTNYKICWGLASGVYSNQIVFGNVTNAVVFPTTPGTTNYFAAKAVDALGNESIFSNETSYSVPTNLPAPLDFSILIH
jgi:hypothetical protein